MTIDWRDVTLNGPLWTPPIMSYPGNSTTDCVMIPASQPQFGSRANGMPQPSCPMSPVSQACNVLSLNVAQLGNAVEQLLKRLDPILGQLPPACEASARCCPPGPPERVANVPLAMDIRAQAAAIDASRNLVCTILERLGLE